MSQPTPHHAVRRIVFILILAGLALHIPFINRDFGFKQQNAGSYFGAFVRNYEKFGIAETGGMPLGVTLLDKIEQGIPYMHHPPGMCWLLYSLGGEEWQMRIPTILGGITTAIMTACLVIGYAGWIEALIAGLVVLVCPAVFFYSQVSFENVVLPLGLGMMLAARKLQELTAAPSAEPSRQRTLFWPRLALVTCTFLGPWIDWAFAFFCVGLVPLLWQARMRDTLRALLLPAVVSATALITVFLWRAWVSELPGLPVAGSGEIGSLFSSSVLNLPALGQFSMACLGNLERAYSIPVIALAALGAWPLFRRCPRLGLALLLCGGLNVLVFSTHSLTHEMFFTYLAPFMGVAIAAFLHAAGKTKPKWTMARYAVAGIAVLVPLALSIRIVERSSTGFYRDLGRILTRASGSTEPDGTRLHSYHVVHSFHRYFGYYAKGPFIQPYPTRDPIWLAGAVARLSAGAGARYLWLRTNSPPPKHLKWLQDMPGLAEYLGKFAMGRLPELEGTLNLNGIDEWVTIDEAWLVTLKHPQ